MNKINLSKDQLKTIIRENVVKFLKESYNDSIVVEKAQYLLETVQNFLDELEEKYEDISSDGNFLGEVYQQGNEFVKTLYLFLDDDHRQSNYQY